MVPERREALRGTPQEKLQLIKSRAVAALWSNLLDFTRLGKVPNTWRRRLPPGTPLLHFPHPAGGLCLNRPLAE